MVLDSLFVSPLPGACHQKNRLFGSLKINDENLFSVVKMPRLFFANESVLSWLVARPPWGKNGRRLPVMR